jgi:hypothetical protein
VLAALAEDAGMVALSRFDPADDTAERDRGTLASHWVVLASSEDALRPFMGDARWQALHPEPGIEVWTDDFSSVLDVLSWR